MLYNYHVCQRFLPPPTSKSRKHRECSAHASPTTDHSRKAESFPPTPMQGNIFHFPGQGSRLPDTIWLHVSALSSSYTFSHFVRYWPTQQNFVVWETTTMCSLHSADIDGKKEIQNHSKRMNVSQASEGKLLIASTRANHERHHIGIIARGKA